MPNPNDGLPFSQACENNKLPILEVLQRTLTAEARVLEIGGGTGQHAVCFAEALPHLFWQSTEIAENLDYLGPRLEQSGLGNLAAAQSLDVDAKDWCPDSLDAIFTANTLHIMSRESVENFFTGIGEKLPSARHLIVYGPFRYNGEFTTESNARFDEWLKEKNPVSGVRDFEWVTGLAVEQGFHLEEDNPMPANNQLLIWRRG